jgi:GTP cyclohydrolase I/GTP cyclohydrolase-4
MATSPHGQSVVAARTRERLAASGFSAAQIASVLEAVPTATHDQIGMGTLHLGLCGECTQEFDAAALLLIVERAMSSESSEPMERDDEGAFVGRAHRRPRWVEDCVHAMIAGVVERFADASDGVFVSAEQGVDGEIHGHRLTAQRAGLLGDLRRELRTGEPTVSRTSMRRWLNAGGR